MEALADCCQREADRSLRRHRHVATCDDCGKLLLAYGNDMDYERTVDELTDRGVAFQVGKQRKLRVVAYER